MSHLGTSPERPQRPSGPGFSTARHDNTHDEKEHKSESCLAVYASRFVISFVSQDIVRTKFFARHPSWLTFWLTATDWVSSGGHLKHRTWANLSCSYLMSWIWSQRVFSPGDGWVFVCSKSVSHCRRLGVRTLDLVHGRDVFVDRRRCTDAGPCPWPRHLCWPASVYGRWTLSMAATSLLAGVAVRTLDLVHGRDVFVDRRLSPPYAMSFAIASPVWPGPELSDSEWGASVWLIPDLPIYLRLLYYLIREVKTWLTH